MKCTSRILPGRGSNPHAPVVPQDFRSNEKRRSRLIRSDLSNVFARSPIAGSFQSNGAIEPTQTDLAVLVLLSRAHGAEAATLARPIFETYANEINPRDAEAESITRSYAHPNDEKLAEIQRSAETSSPIKVHLVRDNITQTVSLEDYVLGVLRADPRQNPRRG